jgi:hypothetical protein
MVTIGSVRRRVVPVRRAAPEDRDRDAPVDVLRRRLAAT